MSGEERVTASPPPFLSLLSVSLLFRGEKRMEDKSSAKTKKKEEAAASDVQSD